MKLLIDYSLSSGPSFYISNARGPFMGPGPVETRPSIINTRLLSYNTLSYIMLSWHNLINERTNLKYQALFTSIRLKCRCIFLPVFCVIISAERIFSQGSGEDLGHHP